MAELKFTYDPKIDKPTAMQVVMQSVESLIEQGYVEGPIESAVLDIVFDDSANTITAVIDDNRMLDQLRSQDYIDSVNFSEAVEDTVRTYSVRTIKERLKISELPLKKQMRYTLLDYRRYYKMQLKHFIENPDEFYRLKAQFVTDFMGYMNLVMESAANGENLAKLLGLNALVPRAAAAGRKLGIDYKMINKVGGAPRALLERTQMHFKEFIDAITDVIFKNWRSKIAGQEELPEPTDSELIEDEMINEEVPNIDESTKSESKSFSARKNEGKIRELFRFMFKGTTMEPEDEEDLQSLVDCAYLGLGSEDPDEFLRDVIEQAKRVAKSRNKELPEELATFSCEMEGEEADGETMELSPAEEEMLLRESEMNGDGRRTYSVSESHPKFRSIDAEELQKLDDKNNPLVDVNALKAQGYSKWIPITELTDEDLRKYLANGAITMTELLFIKDDTKVDTGEEVEIKEFATSSSSAKPVYKRFSKKKTDQKDSERIEVTLDWGYTNDLIKQGYNEGVLDSKELKKLYNDGFKRFYMVEMNEHEANKIYDAVREKSKELGAPNDAKFYHLQDPELGKIWVIFTTSKVAKNFSKSMKKFNHK